MEDDAWASVPGFPGYKVSPSGVVKSLKRGGKILAQFEDETGYWHINLYRNGRPTHFLIHRLVALCWIGEIPPQMEVNHKDGNKSNNSVSNLEIVTGAENKWHALVTGLMFKKGVANPRAKLDEAKVKEMRRMRVEEKATIPELARRFLVTER